MSQMELFPVADAPERLTTSEGLELLWAGNLASKPSGRTYMANRKALCRSFGQVYWDSVTELHVAIHDQAREKGLNGFDPVSPQTRRHDLQLLTLLDNFLRRGKRKKLKIGDVDLSRVQLPPESPTIDIKKPKGEPLQEIVSPKHWSLVMEHASDRLLERAYFAIDTGLLECDLRALRTRDYDPRGDCLRVKRKKTNKGKPLPVTNRCRRIILKAIKEGREFVLDWTNHINEWRRIRIKAKIRFQWRSLRKSCGNHVYRSTGDPAKGSRMMQHSNVKTFMDHYLVDDGMDIRKVVQEIETVYPSR